MDMYVGLDYYTVIIGLLGDWDTTPYKVIYHICANLFCTVCLHKFVNETNMLPSENDYDTVYLTACCINETNLYFFRSLSLILYLRQCNDLCRYIYIYIYDIARIYTVISRRL